MKFHISTFLLILLFTSSASAQWQKIEQDAYNTNIINEYSKFAQKGDTLFSLSSGNLYYTVNNGATVNVYEEKLALVRLAVVGNQVYVAAGQELYRVENGTLTLVTTLTSKIDNIIDFNGSVVLTTYSGIHFETENGYELNSTYKATTFYGHGLVGNKLMFLVYSGGQYKYFNATGGTNLSDMVPFPSSVGTITRFKIFDGRVYVSNSSGNVYSSADGLNWTSETTGNINSYSSIFIDIGEALIYGVPANGDYVYKLKGDSLFNEFTADEEIGTFSNFLYKIDDEIFLLNDAKNLVSYNTITNEWAFIKAAPYDGEYFYVGDSMILSSMGGIDLYKRATEDTYWSRTFKFHISGTAYTIRNFAELPSGRLLAHVTGVNHLYYSDDKGKTWEHGPTKDSFQGSKFIARGDTIFAGNNSYLYMSTDNAETWTENLKDLNKLGASNIKFVGNNSILVGATVYSLADFSIETALKTSEGSIQDYDILNNYEYKGTNSGLYGREIGSSNWTLLTTRLVTEQTPISVIGVIAYQEVIIAVTTVGIYYSSDDGGTFTRVGSEIRSTRSFFVKGNMLYINAYSDINQAFDFYKVDMERMEPLPRLETLAENEQMRVDTLLDLKVKAFIQPRNFNLSVHFEYGKVTSGEFVFTHSTTPKAYPAQDEPFEVEGVIPSLEASTSYRYRAVLTFNDTSKVIGNEFFVSTKSKRLWIRLDPTNLGGDFKDVLVTKRGSIIAWGASGTIRSIDNGKTWRELEEGKGIYSIIRAGGNRLIAGTSTREFMYSFTEGMTWETTENLTIPGLSDGNGRISDITYDGTNSILYALIGEHEALMNNAVYLIKSTDSGNNWTTLLSSLVPNGGFIRDIHVDSSGTLYVTSDAPSANKNMIIKSTDFGDTWQSVLTSEGNNSNEAQEMLQVGRDTLFVNTTMGTYYSGDGGTTFNFAKDSGGNIITSAVVGNRHAFSEEHGLISVANLPVSSPYENGTVSISTKHEDALEFVSSRAVNYFGDPDEVDLRNNNKMIVRNTYVSDNDMVLLATNNGVWRYIPSSDSLLVNPDPNNVSISNEEEMDEAQTFTLFQNYPNPFNPTTNISFQLPSATEVTVKVYDVTGREVATLLANQKLAGGTHSLNYDASNLSSGIYLYKISAGKFSQVRKMTLIK